MKKVKFSVEDFSKTLEFLSDIQDEPFGGIPTMAYSKIFKTARQDGIKVLLDGQGMDEQWAGYDYYRYSENNSTIQGTRGKIAFKPSTLVQEFFEMAEKPNYPQPFDNPLKNMQFRDLFFTKLPRALRFNDRISMAHSVELREPFLDHRMVEYAFAQPESFKINESSQKYLLREMLSPLVSSDISYSPKRVLQTPQREWLGDELKGIVSEKLLNLKHCNFSAWFNHSEIEKEWKKYLNGEQSSSFHIWQWINAETLLNG